MCRAFGASRFLGQFQGRRASRLPPGYLLAAPAALRTRAITDAPPAVSAGNNNFGAWTRGNRTMKLVSISLVSWLSGLLLLLLTFSFISQQGITELDLNSTTITSLIMAALVFSLAYAPSLSWLRRRMGGCRPALLFPLASAVVLNLPVFLIEILAIGRTLAPSEALACIGAFLLMGTVFGLGFVWNYQDAAL